MTARSELEVLHTRRHQLMTAATRRETQINALVFQLTKQREVLEHSLTKQTLERGRSTSERVAMFGFLVLFVGPVVAMFGSALARLIGPEVWLGATILGVGVLGVVSLQLRVLTQWVQQRMSRRWRLVEKARALERFYR